MISHKKSLFKLLAPACVRVVFSDVLSHTKTARIVHKYKTQTLCLTNGIRRDSFFRPPPPFTYNNTRALLYRISPPMSL